MAFPPRQPMMPGMPPQPPMMFGGPPMPPMQGGGHRPRAPFTPRPRGPHPAMRDPNVPSVTVFVGNISERSQDTMIRLVLTTCGPLISWKRVQGATGKLQAFGFCEYGGPEYALRAIRLLHDFEIGDKKLVVKVDSKTKDMLNDYNKKLYKQERGKSPPPEEVEKDFLTSDMKKEDVSTLDKIKGILKDHEKEMKSNEPYDRRRYGDGSHHNRPDNAEPRHTGPRQTLAEVDLEDNKREIIHREIDKFREIMKIREAEKEKEKKEKEKEKEERPQKSRRGTRTPSPPKEEPDRHRERERSLRKRQSRSRSGSRAAPPRPRSGSRGRGRSGSRARAHSGSRSRVRSGSRPRGRSGSRVKDRSRSRTRGRSGTPVIRSSRSMSIREPKSRSRSRSRERRDRERDAPVRKSAKDIRKDEEMDEEGKERKKAERKAREKEAAYQERLRQWEDRESRKTKDIKRETDRELKVLEDTEREARKIREFLEDYVDDRDDSKYYKGSKLEQRLAERFREVQKDNEDRLKEKEELEELKAQIAREGYEDPESELQRRIAFHETFQNQQRLQRQIEQQPPVHLQPAPINGDSMIHDAVDYQRRHRSPSEESNHHIPAHSPDYPHPGDDEDSREPETLPEMVPLPPAPPPQTIKSPATIAPIPISKPSFQMASRRKIDTKGVFNQEDEETTAPKRRKLPLPTSAGDSAKRSESSSTSSSKKSSREPGEDKRKHIKNLIDKIPTDKKELFEFSVEWNMVDSALMEKRIRPWVNKKITEYIGEPEPTLTDFICTKVLNGSQPKSILDDVQVVLDDEAEVFVVKLWRLLIYEIENKKLKMGSTSK